MLIRRATAADAPAIWQIIAPAIRAGETLAVDRDASETAALAYWMAPDKTVFVAQAEAGALLGSYTLRANTGGGGGHVANAGYITAPHAIGRGVARAMCAHSLAEARARGFRAMQFNFVISTNSRAVALWQAMGFAIVGRLPGAFEHPSAGFVDALVMYQTLAEPPAAGVGDPDPDHERALSHDRGELCGVAAAIEHALGDAHQVLNVGAGTGAYDAGYRIVIARR